MIEIKNGGGYTSPTCKEIVLESGEGFLKTSGDLPSMKETTPSVTMW